MQKREALATHANYCTLLYVFEHIYLNTKQKGDMLVIGTVLPGKRRREEGLPSEDYVRKAMPHRLGTFDMTMIFLMVIFFINNPAGTVGAGAAAFSYWIIGALAFFLPCIIATAQLGT